MAPRDSNSLNSGYALYLAQHGEKHDAAKPMKGFGPGVLEIILEARSGTYRAVYTVRLADQVCVLHAFQKKSKRGRALGRARIMVA